MLEGPKNIVIEKALKFEFITSNNQVEYEVLIVGKIFSLEIGATD